MTRYRFARASSVVLTVTALATMVSGPAGATMPDWAAACFTTTENPWITSGYCESHDTWDKYYCKCNFVPPDLLGPISPRRHNLDTFDLDEVER